ncbi:periplasmic heavy metal sensor [Synechococcales cyanobacterium C]|uniref:Periplasmic heavy metal sensor n=1 Tax=Petrachloros mirabilis ULC683 TaxID=2781853 RepID=A0A8K2A6S7_9CYAN|nr:Spy/CpxP family protein refolding chaperone [Petrachloros mirabilis]NCJ06156.1 periplasmic heavy metal sensor [Petrachloros mirabilis ULC683]
MRLRPLVLLAAAPIVLGVPGLLAMNSVSLFGDAAIASDQSLTIAQNAQDSPRQKRGNWQGMRQQRFEALNLTSEQSQQIETIQAQAKEASEPQRQQMREAMTQLRSLMAGNASADQIRQQHQQIQSLRQQSANQRFETMLAIGEVLTPEQRSQLNEMQMERGRRMRGNPEG